MVDCNTVSIIVTSDKPRDVNGDVSGETTEPAVQSEGESPVQSADDANSPMVLLAREKRRRAIRYTAGGAAFIGALFALYHATSNRGTSTLAGILAPAAIMVLYLLWVLYSTRANRHAARVAAAAAAAAAATAVPEDPPPTEATLDVRPLTRTHSKLVLNSPSELSPDSAIPSRLRSSTLHHSTESLFRAGSPRTLNSTPVHRSTINLASRGGSPVSHHGARHAGRAMRSSTLQLNNMRQVAAAAANLPSYEEAINRSHWLQTNNHSRERLLKH